MKPNRLLLVACLWLAPLAMSFAAEVRTLRCESLEKPLGIDVARPRLSWMLESSRRGERQTAYRILVATTPERLAQDQGDLWDSGNVVSDQQNGVVIPVALAPTTAYAWKVRVWDRDGQASAWSPAAAVETGFFDLAAWPARWFNAPSFAVHSARREFSLLPGKTLTRARAYVASTGGGCNSYELRLNGQRVGDDLYAPGPCEPGKSLVSTFDVTSRLQPGENAVGLLYNKRISLYLVLHYADGSSQVVSTDDAWKGTAKGPYLQISGSHPYGGGQLEVYDARQEWRGWDRPGYADPAWIPLVSTSADYGLSKTTPAAWIWSAKPADQTVCFRRTLMAPAAADSSILISGDDGYELYFNGVRLGSGNAWQQLQRHPLRLQAGKNVVAVKVTNTNGPGGLLAEVASGAQRQGTGAGWKACATGPAGWQQVEFDDAGWVPATVIAPAGQGVWGQLSPSPITQLKARLVPCKVIETLKPVAITPLGQGSYLVDFGQEVAGHVRIAASGGKAGDAMVVHYAERLDAAGQRIDQATVYRDARHQYVFKDDQPVIHEPQFFNVGFRYVEVTGYPGVLTAEQITSLAVASEVLNGSSFACSDPLLNRLHKMAVWSFLGNLQNIPTDCPGRERRGWTGDGHAVAAAECLNFSMRNFFDKWLDDHADCQEPNGWIPVELPMKSDPNRDIKWPASAIFIPWDLYHAEGDKQILEKHYPMMRRYLKFLQSIAREDGSFPDGGLWAPWLSYGDWVALEGASSPYLGMAYHYRCADLMAKIAGELNLAEDAAEHAALAAKIKAAIQAKYRKGGTLASYDNNTQSANAHALGFGIAAAADRAGVLQNLIADYQAKGHNTTGFLGIRWVLPVLAAADRNDIAYSYVRNPQEGGWVYFIKRGDATTMYECWDYRNDMSLNHAFMAGSLSEWLYQELAGIAAVQPGYREIRIKPYLPADVSWARAQINTVRGWVTSEWRKSADGRLTLAVTIPANAFATICVPAPAADRVTESGKPAAQADGVKFLRHEKGTAVYAVGSGTYQFSCPLRE